MELSLLTLISMAVTGVTSESHSLRYYYTVTSEKIPGLPIYSSFGYLDDKVITKYSSDVGHAQPIAKWMEDNMNKQFWDEETTVGKNNEAVFQYNVKLAMSRFNKTEGFHMFQYMYGCELKDDGSTRGYLQDIFDRKEFLHLDTENGVFIPNVHEAQMSTQKWNNPELNWGQIWKYYLDNTCIEYLKKYLEYGRDDLKKKVRPEVKVWGRRQSDDVLRLQCLVYGFHPQSVHVMWVRNGEDHLLSDEMSPILPHPDGTYQIRVIVEVPIREGDTFACHVDHSSLEETLSVIWVSPNNDFLIGIISICICICIVVFIAALVLCKKMNHDYTEANIFLTLQLMYGCDLGADGSIKGYYQYALNGRDFLYLDERSMLWQPVVNEAEISAKRWNTDPNIAKSVKGYLTQHCTSALNRYVVIGKEELNKTVRPEVKVWGRHQSDKVLSLQCLVYGFHPRSVHVMWVRNGEDHLLSDEMSPILPHPDGTYQIRVSTEVPIREGDTFSCHVDHSSLEETLSVIWDPPVDGLSVGAIIGIVIGIVVLVAIIAAALWIKMKKSGYKSTNTSDTASDSSNQAKA